MKNPSRPHELPSWLWLWLPLFPVALIVGTYYVAPDLHHRWFFYKEGPLEWATALVLVPGVVAGILAIKNGASLPSHRLRLWIVIVTLGAFYYGGEELSWGQQIWHWDSPEFFEDRNRQQETNIHNMSGWFNEKPRLLLEVWILISAISIGRQRMRPPEQRWMADDWRWWFWPTWVAFPTSCLAIVVYLPARLEKYVLGDFESGTLMGDLRLSEPQEFYFALFLTVYLLSLAIRLKRAPEGVPNLES